MAASDLFRAVSGLSAFPGLAESLSRLLGASDYSGVPENQVLGFHVRYDPALVAVYGCSPRTFFLYERANDGRAFSLMVPMARLRRVALLEDGSGARLTLELESDRSTLTPVEGSPGSLVSVPPGYEIVEVSPAGVASLREFQQALARACMYG